MRAAEQAAAAPSGSIASAADEWPSIVVGFIGESRYQPQAVAALAGAMDAAQELGPVHRLHVTVAHRSPRVQTAAAQNEALQELFIDNTAGVLIHPIDAQVSAPLLTLLNRQRMPVVTLGTSVLLEGISASVVDDEEAIGSALAAEAFALLDGRSGRRSGGVAVLAGPKGVEPYAARARTATHLLRRSISYADYGAFYCEPNMTTALQTLQAVTAAERNEKLSAWICVGPWPLLGYHTDLPQAGGLAGFVVAGGLPQMLPHLEQGSVFSLVSPDYYARGYEGMRQVLLAQKSRSSAQSGGNSQPAPAVSQPQTTAAQGSATEQTAQSVAAEQTAQNPATESPATGQIAQGDEVVRVKILPRIIRRDNLPAYRQQWAQWLAQPMDATP